MNEYIIESYSDVRANRYFDIFPKLKSQITVSEIYPNQISGWHMHKKQNDEFCLIKGNIKIALISESGIITEYMLSEDKVRTIYIPKTYYHCWRNYNKQSILIYHLSNKHDESDEYRLTFKEIKNRFNYEI